jgi:hypothetical protein
MAQHSSIRLAFLLLSIMGDLLSAQGLEVTMTFPGRVDSVFSHTRQLLTDHHYALRTVDSLAFTMEAQSADSPYTLVRIRLKPLSDSTQIAIVADPSRSQTAAVAALLELADAMRPRLGGPRRTAPDGTNWPVDAKGRVGFLVVTRVGARELKMASGDTLPEVRPADLPQAYRRDWEDKINDVGFDASCARFFRARTQFVVRFNFCTAPTADGDRFDVYDEDGGWAGSTIGPTVATYIQAMCPTARSPSRPLVGLPKCPSPFD